MRSTVTTPGRCFLLLCVALAGCGAAPATPTTEGALATTPQAEREQLLDAMKAELKRSQASLRFKDYKTPYFLAYQLKEVQTDSVTARYGGVISQGPSRVRNLYVEVRVGDYTFDNFANIDNESFRMGDDPSDRRAPLDTRPMALRGALWRLTDEVYKKALSEYLTKKGGAVYATEDKTRTPIFSKLSTPPASYRSPVTALSFDRAKWKKVSQSLSDQIKADASIIDSSVEIGVIKTTRYLTTSEGADIADERTIYSIQISAVTRAPDGMKLEHGRSFYARTPAKLPDAAKLKAEVDAMLGDLKALRAAPVIDPYTGPAILMPEASGVLFHEAVGHRLEGERQQNEEEGRTFKGQLGKKIIPAFLSIVDDPTREAHGPTALNGFYKYDDEGVAGQPAVLVDRGVLKAFLKSRTPIDGSPHSNGHGRAQGHNKPMARMANLIVTASPDKSVPYKQLKEMLIAEVKRQNKPFGLIIRDITGGSTNTSGYGYQAFKGTSRMIYKVDPSTGAETLVRGAELVGTPLTSINKIVAASTETDVFNGYCGAESGYVPVSAVAPALLTTEMELQRSQSGKERPPLLPPPWAGK